MSPPRPRASRAARDRTERRRNRTLRETLDDLLEHARTIARRARDMTPEELNYAQQRLEWLADEVWNVATRGDGPAPDEHRPEPPAS